MTITLEIPDDVITRVSDRFGYDGNGIDSLDDRALFIQNQLLKNMATEDQNSRINAGIAAVVEAESIKTASSPLAQSISAAEKGRSDAIMEAGKASLSRAQPVQQV